MAGEDDAMGEDGACAGSERDATSTREPFFILIATAGKLRPPLERSSRRRFFLETRRRMHARCGL